MHPKSNQNQITIKPESHQNHSGILAESDYPRIKFATGPYESHTEITTESAGWLSTELSGKLVGWPVGWVADWLSS